MILVKNATLLTPFEVKNSDLLIEGSRIKKIGRNIKTDKNVKVIDAKDKIVMPGFICAHHHLYSTFARGMTLKGKPARNFPEILKKLWWKLDRALKPGDLYYSSLPVLIDAIKKGITTIIDHHESQGYQIGSLSEIAEAVKKAGIRASLCLGVSDRYGRGKEGLKESERFLSEIASKDFSLINGMLGFHASFTVNERTLREGIDIAMRFNTGIHIHCAEDISDQNITEKKYGMRVIERLYKAGALGKKSIAVHCIHLNEKEIEILRRTDTVVVHNPESNMNNAVGWANILKMLKKGILVGLGSDGMSSNMLREMRVAFLISHHQNKDPRVGFVESINILLKNNPLIVNRIFGIATGVIEEGKEADIIILNYIPPTPLNKNTVLGHILFGIVDATVTTTIVSGKILYDKGKILELDEEEINAKSREKAVKLWKRI